MFAFLLPLNLYSKNIDNDYILVGANIGNVPWEFQDKDGTYIGFEIDLINQIGGQLKRKINIVTYPI